MGLFFSHNKEEGEGLGNGYLYNWYAANNTNFTPADWKLPSVSEYDILITNLGGSAIAGGKMKEAGFEHWLTPNTNASNLSGFTGFGSGRTTGVTFGEIKEGLYLHTTGDFGATVPRKLIRYNTENIANNNSVKYEGASVRLLYTGTGTPTTMSDYDGNTYDVIQIGSQYWTVQNWKCAHLNDGTPLTKVENR